jgi:glycosyltransferase involved in cell wall biosynthesis
MRFCYSERWNDHSAYPMSLVNAAPTGWSYRPTKIHFDKLRGRPWASFETEDNEIIHASSLIPTNETPWVLDIDHVGYLLMQFEYSSNTRTDTNREAAEASIASAITAATCTGVIAWSEAGRDSVVDLCHRSGITPPKICVAYPAVVEPSCHLAIESMHLVRLLSSLSTHSVKLLIVDGQSGVCLMPGRKNVAAGVECFRRLRRLGYHVELIVVGSTENVQYDGKGLHLLPYLSRCELWQLYRIVDILLFLSRQESFGYVLMEAMFNGVCCVATKAVSLPAITELIDPGRTGVLVDYLSAEEYPSMSRRIDEEQLLDVVEGLVERKDNRERIANDGRLEFVEGGRFSLERRNHILSQYLVGAPEWTAPFA